MDTTHTLQPVSHRITHLFVARCSCGWSASAGQHWTARRHGVRHLLQMATAAMPQATTRPEVEALYKPAEKEYLALEAYRVETKALRATYVELQKATLDRLGAIDRADRAASMVPLCESEGTTLPEACEAARAFFAKDTEGLVVSITFNVEGEAIEIDRLTAQGVAPMTS